MLKKALFLLLTLCLLSLPLAACKEEAPTPTPSPTPGTEQEEAQLFDWDFFSDDKTMVRAKLSDAEIEAKVAENALRWEMYEDGTLIIKGICTTAPYFDSEADQPWTKFSQESQEDSGVWRPRLKYVQVEATVLQLPAYAFKNCTDLISVTLPITMSTIPEFCFMGCTSLTTVTGCAGLTTIGQSAFQGCSKLARLEVSVSLSTVEFAAFSEACDALGKGKSLTLQIRGTEDTWNASKETMTVSDVGNTPFKNAATVFIT